MILFYYYKYKFNIDNYQIKYMNLQYKIITNIKKYKARPGTPIFV